MAKNHCQEVMAKGVVGNEAMAGPRVIHFRAPGHSHDNKDKRFFPRPRREVRAQANGKGLCFEIECEGDVVQDHVQEALTCGSMY